MEKEMKKLLLVAVSVGFFLLVTITVAILILTPKTNDTSSPNSISYSNGRVQKNQRDESPLQDISPQYKNIDTQEYNSISDNKLDNIAESDRKDGDKLIISLRNPSTAAVPDTVQTSETQKKLERSTSTGVKAPESVTPAQAVKPSAQTVSSPRTTPTARSASSAKPATPARKINDFWVQTGAFSAQVRAEDARELLAAKGITSIIENREINGKIWYRVRLGPYTSEREAYHWLEIVKLIDGFGNSQIRQTIRAN